MTRLIHCCDRIALVLVYFLSYVYQCTDVCFASSTFIIPVCGLNVARKSIHGVYPNIHVEPLHTVASDMLRGGSQLHTPYKRCKRCNSTEHSSCCCCARYFVAILFLFFAFILVYFHFHFHILVGCFFFYPL